jgi:hypothetical protein
MKTFKITFLTLYGNTNTVYIDAKNKERAILSFENQYQFVSIKYCDEV